MNTIAEQGSRELDAAADLKDLLRLAHSALHRIQQDTHGSSYDEAEVLSLRLHDLRHDAELLSQSITEYVREMEIKVYG